MAVFQIKDGFCINTSGVDGQEIDTISTEITSAASDNVLVTQKAIKDYVDEHGSGGSIPITTKGDMVIGDENGEPSTLTIGTSGQTLMVNSSGMIEYCDILTRNNVSSGNTIGTYTTSATSYNFLDIRGSYGYNTQNAESIANSGVRLTLNQNLLTVNTHGFDLGAPYRPDWLGCGIRYRKTASRTNILLLGDTGQSATSAYSLMGYSLAIATKDSSIYIGTYNKSDKATSALNSFTNPYDLMSYSNSWSYGGKIYFMFPCNPGAVPEWSGASYNAARSYLALGRRSETNNPSGMFEICSSATNKYGDTRAKCDTVALRVKSGWSIFHDKIMFRATSCTTAPIYARKIVTGRTWPNDVIPVSQQQADGGVVYGYGETSARDAITSYGKDPGRQYYTTDDNRVNVYNNTTSGWDKIAYLSDVGGGGGGIVAELGSPFHSGYYDDSDVLSFMYMFVPQSLTISGGFILPIVESLADPSDISVFSAAIYESDTDIYSATKLVETNTFVGTPTLDKKLRFEFTPTALDANKSYWLMLSIKGLAVVPGGNLRLRSFPVDNSNLDIDALSYAVTYDDAAPSLSDFLDYSDTPNGLAPYVRLE